MTHDDDLLDPIETAIEAIAAGRPVLVVDDADRENEGDIIFAADAATDELMGLTVRLGSGVICVAMTGAELDRLALPPMTAINEDSKGTAYSVSVDARTGVTTGISAADRARTARLLADPSTGRGDLARPGHVFPLRARDGGVLVRRGHTEAAVDLCRLAGRAPAGVICEVVEEDGSMSRLPGLRRLADERGWPLVSIADLVDLRRRSEALIEHVVSTRLPTSHGEFVAHGYRSAVDGSEHMALVHGDIGRGTPLVRVHSECLTGDVFGSLRCDCGPQLQAAMAAVVSAGSGVIVYVRGHEGRGIGLVDKLRAYAAQDRGADTVDANADLGLPVDARDYTHAAQVLRRLGVTTVRLLSNNPAKVDALQALGITVAGRDPLPAGVTSDNLHYLRTKRDRMGHDLPWLPDTDEGSTR
ncbi:bifunctional 3,4-dihydroxy-2-butanone-4-phosphate synthase/GTP cyclohydrolase II [Janibacter terrae]|uniref:bifunctional 3,4-dihydroxy-2-butanone-4-phosphate synthase/GTP cyclohydrolase II n=1 Tax=Janibacter terrae TaxID=103817 RepID=UPI0008314A35|nr:bifunctional 3,4-dihydroxy-2-butanone-4-phosphate synthase/GTP cyclohydrolase II [Janibacter terrae]MBA4083432.1 bifunctional 3,4-dihydroxy-2-butanone-4-phosphate synthase/GTP cyclohydrolase II [Kytococcus sp.]